MSALPSSGRRAATISSGMPTVSSFIPSSQKCMLSYPCVVPNQISTGRSKTPATPAPS